ncbi:GNAT family N-acetyltransferase [Desulfobacula sp.]|uniref:GNAT family N-acetyltransferase n=1 Tax=Desulfobacula sp. TaxID=2593537 RepID=UPI001ECE5DC0|nr:GNAT family N-acetyltransferase [Desulfobacula sp.]
MEKSIIVKLRPITSEDMAKIPEWRNKDHIRKWFFNSNILTSEDQEKWYSAYVLNDFDKMFIIQAGSEDIGTFSVYNIDTKNKKAEIGNLMIGEDKHRGKGYAYQAGKLLLEYAFNNLKLERLYLSLFADNIAAFNLYAKLGFVKEGVLGQDILTSSGRKDVILMGLMKRDFYSMEEQ